MNKSTARNSAGFTAHAHPPDKLRAVVIADDAAVERPISVLIFCGNRLLRESVVRILGKKSDFRVLDCPPIEST
ncbi:MAG: hypothetical protein WCD27_03955, partial [Candidatus Acidiferrales bacterium]